MRNHLLAAGVAVAALIPTLALAQQTCEQRSSTNRAVGTIAGAGIGALLGSAVAGHGDRTAGAVIGGVGGAVVGNQIAKPRSNCDQAYGYYDSDSRWHATDVAPTAARGYYDRDGAWIEGAPTGHYDNQGRWVAQRGSATTAGYTNRDGRWVPASADGYYDADGRWVAGAASGHYEGGRWVSGAATGAYDAGGRWHAGEVAGHTDARGMWVADAQPGHYENGRWRVGESRGYYDARGQWIAMNTASAADYGGSSYESRRDWSGAPSDVRSRQMWLEERVQHGISDGRLSRRQGTSALQALAAIRRDERSMRHYDGQLGRRDEARIMARLDAVNENLRWTRPMGRN